MTVFEENIRVNNLIDAYGLVLTKKQQSVLQQYYQFDSSLSEIATELNISRQAVHDMINKSVKTLQNLEEKVGMISKLNEIKKELNKLTVECNNISKQKITKIIDNI